MVISAKIGTIRSQAHCSHLNFHICWDRSVCRGRFRGLVGGGGCDTAPAYGKVHAPRKGSDHLRHTHSVGVLSSSW